MENNVMSPEDFRDEMKRIQIEYNDDYEERHIAMDRLISSVLCDPGYGEGICIFDNIPMWYAYVPPM